MSLERADYLEHQTDRNRQNRVYDTTKAALRMQIQTRAALCLINSGSLAWRTALIITGTERDRGCVKILGCHRLVRWSLTMVATEKIGKTLLWMPRAWPVEFHVCC